MMVWRRGHTVGRGSSAAVSVALSSSSGEVLAVKSVELSKAMFLQREQTILSSLISPHVVGYKGCDVTRENGNFMFNLLMEFVSDGTLSDAIRQQGGRLEESLISHYTRNLLLGLEYIHSRGIVHCDIKGSNILISEGYPKIADFGCARWVNHAAACDGIREDVAAPIGGTPMFMAPEVARGEEQGFPSDVWALGCTVIEMATGRSPWPKVTNSASLLHKIAFSDELPETPEFVSEQAKHFLNKCLIRDPNERWTVKQLLQHPYLLEIDNYEAKQTQGFNTISPTSILDHGIWNSVEESVSESNSFSDAVHQKASRDSPGQRIKQLACDSTIPAWGLEETWVTIRFNEANNEENNTTICGSLTAFTTDELGDYSIKNSREESINLKDCNFCNCREILIATRHENSTICPKFQRHKRN